MQRRARAKHRRGNVNAVAAIEEVGEEIAAAAGRDGGVDWEVQARRLAAGVKLHGHAIDAFAVVGAAVSICIDEHEVSDAHGRLEAEIDREIDRCVVGIIRLVVDAAFTGVIRRREAGIQRHDRRADAFIRWRAGIDAIFADIIVAMDALVDGDEAVERLVVPEFGLRHVHDVIAVAEEAEEVKATAVRGLKSQRRVRAGRVGVAVELHAHACDAFAGIGASVVVLIVEDEVSDRDRMIQSDVDREIHIRVVAVIAGVIKAGLRSAGRGGQHALREREIARADAVRGWIRGGERVITAVVITGGGAVHREEAAQRAIHRIKLARRHADVVTARIQAAEKVAPLRIGHGGGHGRHQRGIFARAEELQRHIRHALAIIRAVKQAAVVIEDEVAHGKRSRRRKAEVEREIHVGIARAVGESIVHIGPAAGFGAARAGFRIVLQRDDWRMRGVALAGGLPAVAVIVHVVVEQHTRRRGGQRGQRTAGEVRFDDDDLITTGRNAEEAVASLRIARRAREQMLRAVVEVDVAVLPELHADIADAVFSRADESAAVRVIPDETADARAMPQAEVDRQIGVRIVILRGGHRARCELEDRRLQIRARSALRAVVAIVEAIVNGLRRTTGHTRAWSSRRCHADEDRAHGQAIKEVIALRISDLRVEQRVRIRAGAADLQIRARMIRAHRHAADAGHAVVIERVVIQIAEHAAADAEASHGESHRECGGAAIGIRRADRHRIGAGRGHRATE